MLLLVDLDGVVYRGATPVPGMAALLAAREAAGDTVIYVTNNSRWHRDEYHARLEAMGVPVRQDRILTAARATALVLTEGGARPLTMVLGGHGLARELREAGLRTVSPTQRGLAAEPEAVAVGVDFGLTYQRLSTAAEAVRRGARFVATNRDPIYPSPDALWAGAGSIVAAVATAGGRGPDLVVGKPEPRLFRAAAESVGEEPAKAVVIGDSLYSDIAAANAIGARCVLMLTGVTSREQADLATASDASPQPTAIAADPSELAAVLERMAAEHP
ncbi:MAG: HAD-IIA family hydrolase [Chloroflexota bacterium]|nr:HAD-IIA family hydrolase [Chloroflexota bacterium]